MERINVKALTLGLGIVWGFYMLFLGWASIYGWGTAFVEVASSVYIGFDPSIAGGVIGGIWGFFDGAIAGAIIALVYNAVAGRE